MKSDNTIRNGTSIFVGIIVAIAAFVHGALLLPLLLVACSVWGLYVLHHLRGSLPEIPKKKEKAPRRAKFVVPDIEDEPLSDILLLHVNQRVTAALRTAGSNITWEWATKDPLAIVKEGGRCLIRVHGLDGFESAEVVLDKQAHLRCELINTVPLRPNPTAAAIGIAANENGYHPIRDYLNGLSWDGTERIRTCLHHFLGADSDQYTYEALRLFLLGAIHRAFCPGCKFEVMLCLVGGQGAGKSTFFRLLAVKDEHCPAYLWRSLTGGGAYAEKIRGGWNTLMEWKNAGGVY